MDIVKKNLWSIICGAVALLAVIALFFPLGGKKEKLQQDLDTRASVYQSLSQLQSKPRTLPIIDPNDPNPKPLDRFPNQQLIDEAKAIPAAFTQQAATIAAAALKLNEHQPLVPGSLPYPASSVFAFNFRDAYHDMMSPNGGFTQMLNAGHPPTPDDITAAQKLLWDKQFVPQLVMPPGQPNGPALNADQIQAAYEAEKLLVPDRETKRVANTCSIYMDATALTVSAAPTLALTNNAGTNAPSPEEIWYAQLGLWIQQDVAQAIIRTNAGFKNVIEAPAKRLVKLTIDPRPYLVPAAYVAGPATDTDDKAPVTKDINISPTGRECNAMYDVVHFDLIIYVAAEKIPWMLDELSDGQFITVLKCDVRPVDAGVDQIQGYIYGTQPVAQLHLVCEEVFLRDWCRKLMPKEVAANLLGVSTVSGGSVYSPDSGGFDQSAQPGGGGPPPPGAGRF
jgi:hypothetical protein